MEQASERLAGRACHARRGHKRGSAGEDEVRPTSKMSRQHGVDEYGIRPNEWTPL
jgi:hypothetical protein